MQYAMFSHPGLIRFTALAIACLFPSIAVGGGIGSVTGQIIFDGPVPQRENIVDHVLDESLIVDAKSKGIANAFVYLPKAPMDIHPDLVKPEKAELAVGYIDKKFVPHAMVIRTGQAVRETNFDSCWHILRVNSFNNEVRGDLLAPLAKSERLLKFHAAESLPMLIESGLHAMMNARWLVVDHPYAVVTDTEGKFTIEKLPEGDHKLRLWHERAGYIERALSVTIKADEVTDLGVIKVTPEKFQLSAK